MFSSVYSSDAEAILALGDTVEFMKTVPSGVVDLIVTSPPYNVGKIYETNKPFSVYLAEQTIAVKEMLRLLKDDGSICWQSGNYIDDGEVFPLDAYFYMFFKEQGLYLRNRIIWRYEHGLHCTKRLSNRYETILWFSKSKNYTFNLDPIRIPSKYPGKRHFKGPNKGKPSGNPLGKNPSDLWEVLEDDWDRMIWEIPNVKAAHPEKTDHPCQFPIELVERCVLALTNEGDLVFDPYAGAGSTLLGALHRNRRAMGVEKMEDFFFIAQDRLSALESGDLKIRPLGKPILKPNSNEKTAQVPKEWKQ
jgi:adenine-specific DNA-methyltransferase